MDVNVIETRKGNRMKKIMFIVAIMLGLYGGLYGFDANMVLFQSDYIDPNIIYQAYRYEPPKINWIGSPYTCDYDGHWLNKGCVVDYQIGFREDGVVVWRLAP